MHNDDKNIDCCVALQNTDYAMWNLFLDDERDPIGDNWVVCRSLNDVVLEIDKRGLPSHISFDHDLGKNDYGAINASGMQVAHLIIDYVLDGRFKLPLNFTWYVHSQNPVGAANINLLLENFMKTRG